MAKITICRDKGWQDKFREYKIILNGQTAGKISQGSEIELNLDPGSHELYAKIDWCRSNKLEFSILKPNDEKKFLAKSSLRGFRLLLGPMYTLIMPSNYLKIEVL